MSLPGELPLVSANRRASAPYMSISSSGSITLPLDLLILTPSGSRISPCRYTVSKGISEVFLRPIIIMRATQKNRMSWPVSMSLPG